MLKKKKKKRKFYAVLVYTHFPFDMRRIVALTFRTLKVIFTDNRTGVGRTGRNDKKKKNDLKATSSS